MAGTNVKAVRDQLFAATVRTSTAETTVEHNKAITDLDGLNTLLTQVRTMQLYRALGNPGWQRVSNFDVNNANAISYLNGGTLKTLAATTTFDTGTTATIAATKWAAAQLSVNSSGTAVVTWYTNAGAGYTSEALAIAAMTAVAATDTPLGHITVQAGASTWTAGTDALQGGVGGTVATTTNYYNSTNANNLYLGSAYTVTAAKITTREGVVLT